MEAAATAKVRQEHARPPLTSSEKGNAGISGRPRKKEITSRYLSSSSSTTASTCSSSNTSSSSASSYSSSRRFPSPLATPRSSFEAPPTARRSQSVDRTRPSTPRSDRRPSTPNPSGAAPSAARRALCTTTRSLSTSFQGPSFSYQASRAKDVLPTPARKGILEGRRAAAATPHKPPEHAAKSKPFDPQHHHRWPAAVHGRPSNPMARILDCTPDPRKRGELLNQSIDLEDAPRRASFDAGDLSVLSDTDSASPGRYSGAREALLRGGGPWTPQPGINAPSKFRQESSGRFRGIPLPETPSSSPMRGMLPSQKLPILAKKPSEYSPLLRPARASSPGRLSGSPCRGVSPLRTRSGALPSLNVAGQQAANAPSILSFATEVRRARKGENRIEEAHFLRLIHNRQLQWRWANARTSYALSEEKLAVEMNVYNMWIAMSELRQSVTVKRIRLHFLRQSWKLTTILKSQIYCLEEWSLVDRDHICYLLGAIEALKASTLRLPIVGGTRADIQEVKDAIGSAVDMMQSMGSSISFLLSKVEPTTNVVLELAKVAAEGLELLTQSRDLLYSVAALHVKQCSLRGHALQLRRERPRLLSR